MLMSSCTQQWGNWMFTTEITWLAKSTYLALFKKKKMLILAKKYRESILCLSLRLGIDQEKWDEKSRDSLSHQIEDKNVGSPKSHIKGRSNYSYMQLHNGKCVVRRFYCANIIECIYTNLDVTAYYNNCTWPTFVCLAMQVCLHHKCMSNAQVLTCYHGYEVTSERNFSAPLKSYGISVVCMIR